MHFSTAFVSRLANRSLLIGSKATERGSLSAAHKVLPRSIKERVKLEGVHIKRGFPPCFYFCVLFKL